MPEDTLINKSEKIVAILTVGALWGIFEATVGYLLHLLPVSIGFLVWYPAAVGFMVAAYRLTGERRAVLAVAVLSAAIKLFNLLMPIRADYVINPAVSIVLESLALIAALSIAQRAEWAQLCEGTKKPWAQALLTLLTNTLWRGMYIVYLSFIVPDWVREASVLRSSARLIRFMVTDNLCSSAVIFGGLLLARHLAGRITPPQGGHKLSGAARTVLPAALLVLSVTLQLVL